MSDGNKYVPRRHNWKFNDIAIPETLTLDGLVPSYIYDMLNKTLMMFEYDGLPDGITSRDMERFTQLNGYQLFIKDVDRYYILRCSLKEGITWNSEPDTALVTIPALPNLKKEWNLLNDDCVLFQNDELRMGLFPIIIKNAQLLAHADISLLFATVNTRLRYVLRADDDNIKNSLDKMLDDIFNGEHSVSIATSGITNSNSDLEAIQLVNSASSNDIKDLVELKQYLKASWYMDLGINANYNMKREAINESESEMNDDALMPLIDNMMRCRKNAVEAINAKFGLNISVRYSSSWAKLRKEIELSQEAMEAEIPSNEQDEQGEGQDSAKEVDQDAKN